MSDFQLFIETNNLLKKEIANYLGVSNAFITQLCSGKKSVPPSKMALIKANPYDWDLTMFNRGGRFNVVGDNNSGVVVNGDNNNSPIDNRHYYSDSPDVLRAQIELLDERIKEKDAQIKEKDAQIKEKDAQIKQLLDILAKR
jgi:transcriptional regulator with XRE-family HTH domain